MVRRTAGQYVGRALEGTQAGVGFPWRHATACRMMAPLSAEGRGGARLMWSHVFGWVWAGSSGARLGLSGGVGKERERRQQVERK